jgi:phosphoglycolate phosphatase
MKSRAVLFDLDGTLLDTLEDLTDATNAVLRRLGYPEHAPQAYKIFVGDGIEELALRALPETERGEDVVRRTMAGIRKEYGERWADKTHPYPGVPELLDALQAHGLPLAILSNKPHELTRLAVERLLPHWRFSVVLGARPDVPRKPDPQAALEIAAQLAIAPSEFIYLGDTGTDMKTATAAGMFAVGALWGFRSAEELLANGASALIDEPMELLGFLRE